MASNNNSNNIDITYATMGEVMDYQTSSPTSGFTESSTVFDDDGTTPIVSVEVGERNIPMYPSATRTSCPTN